MNVTGVEAIPVEVPLRPLTEPNGLAPYVMGTRDVGAGRKTLVRIDTDEGVTGWGEMNRIVSPTTAKSMIETEVAPYAIGKSVTEIGRFLDEFEQPAFIEIDSVTAGVEMAMWDALGKHLEVPVHQLFGGKRTDAVEFAYCVGILDVEDSTERVRSAKEQGFTTVKTKAGGYADGAGRDVVGEPRTWQTDVERLTAMSEAVDGAIELRADPNQSLSVADTVRLAAALEDAGVYMQYFEQPIRTDNLGSYKRLRQRLRTPIAVNEELYRQRNFFELIREDAVDVGVIDLVAAGGLLPMKRLASVAEEADVPLAHHCGFDLGIKTAAILHAVSTTPAISLPSDTVYYALEQDVLETPFEFENGCISVPDGPGLGVEVDEAIVEKYRIG